MKNKIIKHVMLAIFSAVLIFQFLLLFSVIPYNITWGGRLETYEEMLIFVSFSIILNSFFLFTILVKTGYLKIKVSSVFIKVILWLMVAVFTLNTVGNLFAIHPLERYIATPITLILAIFSYLIATEDFYSNRNVKK